MNEKGVSPVIGVMLMLVVAVLLAAAVSTYVGQMQMKKPAPTAVFDCRIVKDAPSGMGLTVTYLELKEVSGDTIPTKDLEIITYNPDAHGPHKTMEILPNSGNTHFYLSFNRTQWNITRYPLKYYYDGSIYVQKNTTVTVYNTTATNTVPLYVIEQGWMNGTSPYLNNVAHGYFGKVQKYVNGHYYDVIDNITFVIYYVNSTGSIVTATVGGNNYNISTDTLTIPNTINVTDVKYVKEYLNWKSNNPAVDFGNYTISPGITMTADWYNNYPQSSWNSTTGWYNGANVTGFCACIADGWNVTPGHYITVKIVYIPTHTVIWEKKVMVESGE